MMVELLAALQFLTIFPPVIQRPFTPGELGRSVGLYPLVGVILGGALVGLAALLMLAFSPAIAAALLLAAWVVSTRALHMDGFMDTCDGLFGGFTPERRLEIMRDSRVGAFGVAGEALLVLVKFALLAQLVSDFDYPALLLTPVIGRWAMTLAVVWFPYARPSGMGREIKDNAGLPQFALATLTMLLAAFLAASWMGLAAVGVSAAVVMLWLKYAGSKIPGLTGDIYGATCEIAEVLAMLLFAQHLL
ncbi:MAG: adenosylcobinamide-GDP ribazoletransferase [Anaerolineales bacterium]|jgi:adenosylcobinamide-GDP ribazoletransferase